MIELFKSADGWRYRVKADNGEILVTGEAYVTKAGAMDGVFALFHALGAEAVTHNYLTKERDLITMRLHISEENPIVLRILDADG